MMADIPTTLLLPKEESSYPKKNGREKLIQAAVVKEFLILSRGPLHVEQASIAGVLPSVLAEMYIADT